MKDPLTGGEKGAKLEAFALIPVEPLEEVARVYGYGATKYSLRNWEKGYDWSLSYSALQRHINEFWKGRDLDAESGLPHLAHAVFHCLAMMEWAKTHPEKDDRVKSKDVKEITYATPIIPDPPLPAFKADPRDSSGTIRPDSNAF